MSIFAVIRQPGEHSGKLGGAIAAEFPVAHYDVGNGVWLVATRGTAKDLSDRLQITNGENGSAIVVEFASYFGRANPAIWSWVKANWEARPVG